MKSGAGGIGRDLGERGVLSCVKVLESEPGSGSGLSCFSNVESRRDMTMSPILCVCDGTTGLSCLLPIYSYSLVFHH